MIHFFTTAQTTQECVSSICRLDLQAKADSKLNESVESIESSVVGFHFSPPVMLLKPVTRNSPPCLETRLETVQGNFALSIQHNPKIKTQKEKLARLRKRCCR